MRFLSVCGIWTSPWGIFDKVLLSGPCHQYVHQRGRTGGWQDLWCPHETKIGAKMEALQESVSDVSDIIHSLKKLPTLHVLDDPCHFVRYFNLPTP